MNMTEESMCFLEEHIPILADAAVKQAYWQALAAGSSVLVCKDGVLVEIFPDGTENTVRQLEPQTVATIGQRLELS
ncbi:MAG: hypothetical protein Q7S71_04300 [Candidatus Nitrotoga sp.]|nr:hypothetical protein [Candidatus Nitrotoga sp.]